MKVVARISGVSLILAVSLQANIAQADDSNTELPKNYISKISKQALERREGESLRLSCLFERSGQVQRYSAVCRNFLAYPIKSRT
jgi:hypothetical protein